MQREEQPYEIYESVINKAVEYILENLEKPLVLKQIATIASMSPFHFHRIFKKVKGETLSKFIQRTRVEKAAQLIKSKRTLFLHEIGYQCGFSSQSLFVKNFRKHYNITPYEYKKKLKIK